MIKKHQWIYVISILIIMAVVPAYAFVIGEANGTWATCTKTYGDLTDEFRTCMRDH